MNIGLSNPELLGPAVAMVTAIATYHVREYLVAKPPTGGAGGRPGRGRAAPGQRQLEIFETPSMIAEQPEIAESPTDRDDQGAKE